METVGGWGGEEVLGDEVDEEEYEEVVTGEEEPVVEGTLLQAYN